MKLGTFSVLVVLVLGMIGCPAPAAAAEPNSSEAFATASQIESTFRGQSFVLGDDTQVANVRALDWSKDHSLKLPYWLGNTAAVPPSKRPQIGRYYVISEAYAVRSLGGLEWLIRAGSSLQKPDAVLITNKTRYKTTGVILPTIVQYTRTRTFTREDGSRLDVPVLEEVSLPAKWTQPGKVPTMYARFLVHR
jgi:hypothetical protein